MNECDYCEEVIVGEPVVLLDYWRTEKDAQENATLFCSDRCFDNAAEAAGVEVR